MEKTPNWKTEELSQKNDWFVLPKKGYWRQHIPLLAACVVIVVVGVLINNAWVVPFLVEHQQNEMVHNKVSKELIRLEETLNNMMTEFSELKDRLEAENEQQQGTISELQRQVIQLGRETSELKASKADQDEVDELSTRTAELNESKVDNDEFNDLVDTVSEVANKKADRATVMELAEELVSNFTSLANTTVRTSEFLLLSERVEDVDDTTVKEAEFFNVAMKVTTLEGDMKHVNVTLAMKADRQSIKEITDKITSLKKTTVSNDKFQKLVTTVGSKADRSDLSHLRQVTATKSEHNSLSGRLSSHITSSQNEHDQLGSRISDNDRDIETLKNRIGTVESDIEDLKSAVSQECKKVLWWCTN